MKQQQKLLLIISLLVASCTSLVPLSIERQEYNGNNLRIDGLYYLPGEYYFFLFQNGVYFDGGSTGLNLNAIEELYFNKSFNKNVYILPYCWGIFNIQGNQINIEKWTSTDAFAPYKTTKFSGQVLNDTTLIINHPASSIGSDTFYFHQFMYKPDSTNKFIK